MKVTRIETRNQCKQRVRGSIVGHGDKGYRERLVYCTCDALVRYIAGKQTISFC